MPASAEANPFRAPAEHVERHGRPLTVRDLRSLLIFAAAYFAACGYGSLFGQTRAAPLWFPDSVLLCALLLTPFGKWWLYLLAALPIRLLPALHPPVPDWFMFAAKGNYLPRSRFVRSQSPPPQSLPTSTSVPMHPRRGSFSPKNHSSGVLLISQIAGAAP
jgi:hypothetical protein